MYKTFLLTLGYTINCKHYSQKEFDTKSFKQAGLTPPGFQERHRFRSSAGFTWPGCPFRATLRYDTSGRGSEGQIAHLSGKNRHEKLQ